jgi:hypothetical protein
VSPDTAAPPALATVRLGAACLGGSAGRWATAPRLRRWTRGRPAGSPRACVRRPRRRRSPAAPRRAGERRRRTAAGRCGTRSRSTGCARRTPRPATRREGLVADDAAVERQQGGHALDRISSSARRLRSSASCRVAPVTISLASSESKRRRRPTPTPRRSRPDPRSAGGHEAGDRAGGGQEPAAGVLAVDAELEGVPARRRVGEGERQAVGDAELLATRSTPVTSSVTGCSTCRRVFTSRKEMSRLRRPGTRRCRRRRSRPRG